MTTGKGLADIEALRQQMGGDLRAKPVTADDGQLDLFSDDGPPPAGDERES
jgi:hypothetical protein